MKRNNREFNPLSAGVFMTVPFVLALPPVIAWYIGKKLEVLFELGSWLSYACLFLGLLSGLRETYRIIKTYGDT
jgi:ATP synthase protein I